MSGYFCPPCDIYERENFIPNFFCNPTGHQCIFNRLAQKRQICKHSSNYSEGQYYDNIPQCYCSSCNNTCSLPQTCCYEQHSNICQQPTLPSRVKVKRIIRYAWTAEEPYRNEPVKLELNIEGPCNNPECPCLFNDTAERNTYVNTGIKCPSDSLTYICPTNDNIKRNICTNTEKKCLCDRYTCTCHSQDAIERNSCINTDGVNIGCLRSCLHQRGSSLSTVRSTRHVSIIDLEPRTTSGRLNLPIQMIAHIDNTGIVPSKEIYDHKKEHQSKRDVLSPTNDDENYITEYVSESQRNPVRTLDESDGSYISNTSSDTNCDTNTAKSNLHNNATRPHDVSARSLKEQNIEMSNERNVKNYSGKSQNLTNNPKSISATSSRRIGIRKTPKTSEILANAVSGVKRFGKTMSRTVMDMKDTYYCYLKKPEVLTLLVFMGLYFLAKVFSIFVK